ncbi:anaphase-promoting complex subunit, putative [Entamoeba invadens IP1]|uniref:anaphase-promoting complex subunit, putative n=1 Tax=Entamoeba invadens IP1 TaxID=370355 RepID=UPI0002C3F9AD|nr:anaphase-promoting complex subunit, putative [Entamoeba invadens IP1]ELP93081.1 anaphase-promoting complex subunit, putative [Entamoeba invadens IP1]|eukprot:XP_004259852.1 anaphase-promoting complex subunit, putative [Entamoeba invadens IP1]
METEPSDQSLELLNDPTIKEVTREAFVTVSSSRIGYGLSNIFDNDKTTFWQSNGNVPHTITFLFDEIKNFAFVRVYISHSQDETYTPTKLILKIGVSMYDMIDNVWFESENPEGWCYLTRNPKVKCRGSCLQLVITENSNGGRDSHIRQIEVYAFDESNLFSIKSNAFSCCAL